MGITSAYNVAIFDDENIRISHPKSDIDTYDYVKSRIDSDHIIKLFVSSSPGSEESHDWLIENFSGLKEIVQEFSKMHHITISQSVIKLIK